MNRRVFPVNDAVLVTSYGSEKQIIAFLGAIDAIKVASVGYGNHFGNSVR